MNKFSFVDCKTVDEALGQLNNGATVKAGGIDLLDLMKEGIVAPPKLVNIRNVDSLRGITVSKDGLHLGPLVTLSEIAAHPDIQRTYSGLSDAAGHAATPQVRNMATVGGNIMQRPRCWYFRSTDFDCRKKGTSDVCHALTGENQYHAVINNSTCAMVHPSSTAVPLLGMNATVELTSKRGKRTVAMSDFYVPPEKSLINETVVQPGELITGIFVPAPEPGTRSAYQKYGEKESFDWPIADAGIVLVMDGNRCRKAAVVMGVAAPTPIRSAAAEAVLTGKTIDEATARAAAKAAMQGATPLSQNGYKTQLFQTAIYRTVLLAAGQMQRDPSAIG
ncbi:FAD binding domain-containing protein [Acidipila rosea]|uniref:Xanthine dehydrogenase YagS FAD-binding subunit n=1 Tax=Acidipila rosea TaxID=768535 RepID=A0A4R1L609_9BACT|nr:xanthine dehydrogenase family protein subunit M [Acidipila rosea]TCK73592.1 xanthine dehydrogenase YagS FAD-binding subunit [Acidipila rosea]